MNYSLSVKDLVIEYGTRAVSDRDLLGLFGVTDLRGFTLKDVARMPTNEICYHFKVTKNKAALICAAFELSRRQFIPEPTQLRSSRDAYDAIMPHLIDLQYEKFYILLLNRANMITGVKEISSGGVSGTVVDAKLVFQTALHFLASSIILCHNHPSGNLKPSQADIDLTKKMRKAGESLDIGVLDHIIVSGNSYYSFSDEGII